MGIRRCLGAAIVAGALGGVVAAPAGAETSLPVFTPYPSDWSPDYSVFPYDLWQVRVTPEQVVAQRDACQWFNAQYDSLMGQVHGFNDLLGDRHDVWTASGVDTDARVVAADLDQSAAFLDPRVHTLYITNYPDLSEYSPLYNGDSLYHLWFQLTQISDKITRRLPSGQIHANVVTADVYGNVIRTSGVCDGA